MPNANVDRRLTRLFVFALLLAAALRVVASVVSGFATLGTAHQAFPGDQQRTGEVLQAFGSGGDTIEALLLVAAFVLLWRGFASAAPPYRAWLTALAAATVALVGCRVAGLVILTSNFTGGPAAAEQAVAVGFGVADVVVASAVLAAVRLLPSTEATDLADVDDPVLFAIDRKTGEAFAFFSASQARRSISVYSIEDNEFAFYDDDGRVVEATADEGRAIFTTTDVDRRDELLSGLRRFAAAKSLEVDDPGEPLAYVQPINEWQWLELWPGWMRGIGRPLARIRRR